MKRHLCVIAVTLATCLFALDASMAAESTLKGLKLPDGFSILVYADRLNSPRLMAYSPEGVLHVTETGSGRVIALPDKDSDGAADERKTVARGLDRPHGIAFYNGYVYIAESGKIIRFRQDRKSLKLVDKEVIVPDLPTKGGGHFTRTIAFGSDGKMYVSVGSSCNVCVEKDKRRAAVLRFNPDGSNPEVFAEGLRNSVGIVFHPATGELYGTENSRDWLGEDLPPDEVNLITHGANYGWPFCFGQRVTDPAFTDDGFCEQTIGPALEIQAHSAPLGLRFYTEGMFPEKYDGRLFIAFHGSWNRVVPTGYKIISVPLENGKPTGRYEDFITGWLRDGKKAGRPVDIIQDSKGALLISDDHAGIIYRVTYKDKQAR